MARHVVHHALHPDEGEAGIYRLVHAEAIEHVSWDEVENPDYDPSLPEGHAYSRTVEVENPDFRAEKPNPEFRRFRREDPVKNPRTLPLDEHPIENPRRVLRDTGERVINYRTIQVAKPIIIYSGHQDIIWHAGDPRWAGMDPEQIAVKQRQEAGRAMRERERLAVKEARQVKAAVEHLDGSVGQQL